MQGNSIQSVIWTLKVFKLTRDHKMERQRDSKVLQHIVPREWEARADKCLNVEETLDNGTCSSEQGRT